VVGRFLVLIVLNLLNTILFSQNLFPDSLEYQLHYSKEDSSTVNLLNELSNKYLTYKPSEAKRYADNALQMSLNIGYAKGEATALLRIGEYEFRQSNYAKAVEYSTQSLNLAIQLQDSIGMANAYRILGNTNTFGFKQYDLALDYQTKALSIFKATKDLRNVASLYGNISWIYASTGEKLNEAKKLAKRGVDLADSLHSYQLVSYNYNSLGLIAMEEENFDSAFYFLNRSIEVGKKVYDRAVISYNKSIIGDLFLKKNELQNSLNYFHQAETESTELNAREILKETYKGLAEVYARLKLFPKAYSYQHKYSLLKDSLLNWEITQKALAMNYELEEQRRESKITELQQLADRAEAEKNILKYLFSLGSASFLIIMGLIIRNNRQRRKSNELLSEKNKEIAIQNKQLQQVISVKDKLFSIIGHDLRSPLNSLKGMLGLVVRKEVTDEEFNTFAPKLYQHVTGANETLENLLHWSHSQMDGWKVSPSNLQLSSVINRVLNLLLQQALHKKITINQSIEEDIQINADPNLTELIFRNLIHNAIKYTPENGIISIKTIRKDNFIETSIIDSGIGMSHDFVSKLFVESIHNSSRGTQGERGTGLGLKLCNEMVKANNGRIKVESDEGLGSTFTVILPVGV
jgi:signal transduction histidine kinase